jgi:hypothetical protein
MVFLIIERKPSAASEKRKRGRWIHWGYGFIKGGIPYLER